MTREQFEAVCGPGAFFYFNVLVWMAKGNVEEARQWAEVLARAAFEFDPSLRPDPMPRSGATKLSPRESAERSATA